MADWKPGDSALCVNAKPFICASCGWRHLSNSKIAAGRVYQVQVVTTTEAAAPGWGCDRQALIFTDGTRGDARRFRKLPPYQFTEDDLEVIDLMKREPDFAAFDRAHYDIIKRGMTYWKPNPETAGVNRPAQSPAGMDGVHSPTGSVPAGGNPLEGV